MKKQKNLLFALIIIIIFAVALIFIISSNDSEEVSYIASGHPQWAPIMYQEGDKIVGVGPEIIQKISEDLDISIVSKYKGSWDLVQDLMLSGDIDIIVAAYKTEEREIYMDFSIPYTIDPVSLFVKEGLEFPFDNWDELIEKKGIVTIGDSYGQEFDNFIKDNLNVEEVASPSEAFELLINEEADYFVYALYSGENYLKNNNMTDEIVSLENQVSAENFYITISKKSPLINYLPQINSLINEYINDGIIDELVEQYK